MLPETRVLELREYEASILPRDDLPTEIALVLSQEHSTRIELQRLWQSDQWQLKSLGWVGYLPVTRHFGLRLLPKVPLTNVLRMFEYAYRLPHFLKGTVKADSLEEFYSGLAYILASRVMQRARRGLYRTYLQETDDLLFIRGRIKLRRSINRPWQSRIECDYEEHTADIIENQILTWTLHRIARGGVCSDAVLPTVRQAYRALHGAVSQVPVSAKSCMDRLYNRLNDDYESLHSLCRFFLEHSGPTHTSGEHKTIPFLVDMARLFELFVMEWLREHLPARYEVRYQDTFRIGAQEELKFLIDMVLWDREEQRVASVIDAKYKTPDTPATDDVAQVNLYAQAKRTKDAVLVYPTSKTTAFSGMIGDTRVRTLTFVLNGDLEATGREFMNRLISPEAS